ncbi:MAG: flagellar hook-associated protein FlgK [Deltaproteobacteria bacterium]|nr:flagellar hook-associated protein FlgK [Deltaproteobacteria bacterium]
MGLFDALGAAGNSLTAYSFGIGVRGNNVGEASSPGFRRREAILGSLAGGGARVVQLKRSSDLFVESRALGLTGSEGFASARLSGLVSAENSLGAIGSEGIAGSLSRFFSGFTELGARPDDPALRNDVLSRAEELAASFRRTAQDLVATQRDLDGQIRESLPEANRLIDELGALNSSLSKSPGPELLDRRDRALADLARLTGATARFDNLGRVTVSIGGMGLVSGEATRHLVGRADPSGFTEVSLESGGLLGTQLGGEVGGWQAARDGGAASALVELDQLAFDISTAVNSVHSAGVGLDGVGGRNLFVASATVAGAAIGMSVDVSVAGHPLALAAGSSGAAGDGALANQLAALMEAPIASSGTRSPIEAMASLFARVGQDVRSATETHERVTTQRDSVTRLADAVGGVSIEEEMLALTRLEHGHQAVTRVIQTIDGLLEDLIRR